ncbi:hypothetical protein QJS10_CPA07g00700 [Acorus calamus]|uniref:F-box associated beta-propeller type 3 domain-containing protein n=1 Tax=Acorus calamus TaxID=4465 RepID=A0AAV9EHZ1_ACOCL|nr:hypothetical protein QJS10_CPA07g00700 [Acorus calamus]
MAAFQIAGVEEILLLPEGSEGCVKDLSVRQMQLSGGAPKLGLGFDSKKKKYKVVHLFHKKAGNYKMHCEVFEQGSRHWREVMGAPYLTTSEPPAFVNESLYWMIDSGHKCEESILAFNVQTEEFRTIKGRAFSERSAFEKHVFLRQLGGELCLVSLSLNGPLLEIWKLEIDEKGNEIWEKHNDIKLTNMQQMCGYPLAIHDSQVLVASPHSLGYYDPNNEEVDLTHRGAVLTTLLPTVAFGLLYKLASLHRYGVYGRRFRPKLSLTE